MPPTSVLLTVSKDLDADIMHALHNVSSVIQRSGASTICEASVLALIHPFMHTVFTVLVVSGKDLRCVNNYFSVYFALSLKTEEKVPENKLLMV